MIPIIVLSISGLRNVLPQTPEFLRLFSTVNGQILRLRMLILLEQLDIFLCFGNIPFSIRWKDLITDPQVETVLCL